ncbi:MAG: hypothetical protein NC307_08710 [Roseburia sp.]|nr:hypothetical protein [Roseburia sp.]
MHIYNPQTGSLSTEVAKEIVDGITSFYYLNGERILEASTGGDFTSEDMRREREITSRLHKAYQRKGYNPLDNSINISVGDVYDLENGYRLRVKANSVVVEKYGAETF